MYHSYSNSKSFYLLISFTSVKSDLCTTIIVLEYSLFDHIFNFTSEFYTFLFFMFFMSFLSIWKTFKKFYKARLVMIDTLFLFLEYSSTGYIIFFPLNTLTISCHSLLDCKLHSEKYTDNFVCDIALFSSCFQIFLWEFKELTLMFLRVIFVLILCWVFWNSCILMPISLSWLGKFSVTTFSTSSWTPIMLDGVP